MPARKQNSSFDRQAAASMFAQILDELRSGGDIERLNECRALFRGAVPFHLRSYAAAALMLRALDSGAPGFQRGGRDARRERAEQAPRRDDGRGKPAQGAARQATARNADIAPPPRLPKGKNGPVRAEKATEEPDDKVEPRIKEGRYRGEGVTIFLGMGRRQRFNARSVFKLLSERTQLEEDQVGEIRGRDNYTFLVLAPEVVETTLAALDGSTVKGRRLAVSLARKKEERAPDDESAPDRPVEGLESTLPDDDERATEDYGRAVDDNAAYDMGAYGDEPDSRSPEEAGGEETDDDDRS